MTVVIDLMTRQPRPDAPKTDEQRAEEFASGCLDRVLVEALKLRAISGLDEALRVLGKIADELRNHGRTET